MKELKEGIHYYLDEKGLIVLTAQYHHERGYCCGMGCRHCPFEFENVPEPAKTRLKQEKAGRSNTTTIYKNPE